MNENIGAASSIPNFSQRNGIGPSTVYKEIRAGRLIARKIGRRTIITDEDERAWRNKRRLIPFRSGQYHSNEISQKSPKQSLFQ